MEKPVQITMLGKFTIYGDGLARPRLVSLTGRSRRLWILVVYLILNRERGVPAQELIDWLWPEATGINPVSTLQNNISRARNALEELGLEPIFQLGMRLGEGSGCPLAFQVLSAACAVINDMATFDQAGIDDGYLDEIREGDKFTVEASK